MQSGEVVLLSVRTQLLTSGPKASASGTYNMDGMHENNKCNAVAWVPKSNGTTFAAAFNSSGVIHFYKKAAALEADRSKFYLGSGGSSSGGSGKNAAPERVIAVGGGGVNDISFSPDGSKLAAVSRDGLLRVLEVASGQLLCGFHSYYGALLCCAFSPDGQYVATGGEDDLVAMFSLHDRSVTAWGEAHSSWVSRLAFDPWHQQASLPSHSDLAPPELVYRLASVGADCCLCLWDFVISDEYIPPSPTATRPGHMRKVSSGANLGGLQQDASFRALPVASTPPRPVAYGPAMAPSTPRAEMVILQPVMQHKHKVHLEPLSDVAFLDSALLTACHTGVVKCWRRPQPQQRAASM